MARDDSRCLLVMHRWQLSTHLRLRRRLRPRPRPGPGLGLGLGLGTGLRSPWATVRPMVAIGFGSGLGLGLGLGLGSGSSLGLGLGLGLGPGPGPGLGVGLGSGLDNTSAERADLIRGCGSASDAAGRSERAPMGSAAMHSKTSSLHGQTRWHRAASSRGSGRAPGGPAASWECLAAAQSGQARPGGGAGAELGRRQRVALTVLASSSSGIWNGSLWPSMHRRSVMERAGPCLVACE